MFKNIIAPVQAWLLAKGQCVGCSMPLAKGHREKGKKANQEKVTCKCGRIFIYDKSNKKYRRALFKEVEINRAIPEKHFPVIAKILVWAFALREGKVHGEQRVA